MTLEELLNKLIEKGCEKKRIVEKIIDINF